MYRDPRSRFPHRHFGIPWLALAVALAGLTAACDRKDRPSAGPPRRDAGQTAAEPKGPAGRESMFFPSGTKEGSTIRVDKDMPAEIWVGRAFTETITVTNVSPKELHNVVVRERLSPNFEPARESKGEVRREEAVWNVGSLQAGESRTFQLTGTPRAPGEIRHCLRVDFQPELCTTRTAAVAALELSLKGPKEVLICEPIDYALTVRNSGTARLDGVKVDGALPEGAAVDEGRTSAFSLDAGPLGPGESKDLKVRVKPSRRGEVAVKASAAAQGVSSDASWTTVVREPVLELTARATPTVFSGAPAQAEVVVANRGDGPSPDTIVEVRLPQGIRVTDAGRDAIVSQEAVTWKIGALPAGERRTLKRAYAGSAAGRVEIAARGSGPCVQPVQASATTEIRGIPAVLLEVVDDPDPVAVGSSVTYTITVTNQGNASLSRVRVTCGLEDSMTFVSSEGPTPAKAADRSATFEPLDHLEPKGKATWKVVVRATRGADARFKVSLTSDQVERPVEETESTHFVVQSR